MNYALIALVVIILAAVAVNYYKNLPVKDIVVPFPAEPRKGVHFTYFGAEGSQVAETMNHITMLWECQWPDLPNNLSGRDKALQNIMAARMFTVLDVNEQVFKKFADEGKNYAFNPFAEQNLTMLFDFLRDNGALKYVRAITPIDEPNINVVSAVDLLNGIHAINKIAANYTELRGFKMVVIYAREPKSYTCFERFHWIGFNDYEMKSQIIKKVYQPLEKDLLPDQSFMLIPGGAFDQDPTPFVNYALTSPRVAAVVAFVWCEHREIKDNWNPIRSPGNKWRDAYIAAGRFLSGK